jgi:pectate lyase
VSAEVGADPAQHNYVALAADPTGALGAWVRKIDSELQSPRGAARIGLASGVSAQTLLTKLDRQYGATTPIRGRKRKAYTWAAALAMAADLSGMYGYAAEAGTVGGSPTPDNIYKVWNRSGNASVIGSLPWAIDQHNTGTGRSVIVTKAGDKLRVTLEGLQNIKRGGLTICDAGRVLTLAATRDIEMLRVSAPDVILRDFRLVRHSSLSPTSDGTAYERDGLSIRPDLTDKVWVDGVTFLDHGDGACDVAAPIDVGAPQCRFTISRCRFMHQEKTMLIGSTITSYVPAWAADALAQDPVIFGTLYQNSYEGAAFRCPQVIALAFVHSVENVYASTNYVDDTGNVTPSWMIQAITGGKCLSERDYIISTSPTELPRGISAFTDPWDATLKTGPGAVKVIGSVSDSDHPITEGNVSSVPAVAYTKPIPVNAMPATQAERILRAKAIMANAGAEINPVPDRLYEWAPADEIEAQIPFGAADGYNILKDLGTEGYYVAVTEDGDGVSYETTDPNFALERGYTRTVGFAEGKTTLAAIGATELDIMELANSSFAVDGNGTGATIGAIVSSDGLPFANGQILYIRCASSARPIIVQSGTNLDIPGGPITLDSTGKQLQLKYDNGSGKFSPVGTWLAASVPTLASGTFTPPLTAVANCSGLAVTKGQYARNGSMVNGSLRITGTQTAASTVTQIEFAKPVASNLAASSDLQGTCATTNTTSPVGGYVMGIASTDVGRAGFVCSANPGATFDLTIMFQYEVK